MRGAIDAPFSLRGLEASNVGEIIQEVVSSRLASWPGRSSIVISTETNELALTVLFRIMGVEPGAIPQWHKKYRDYTLGVINEPFEVPGGPRWRAKRAIAWIDDQFTQLVAERRRERDRQSFLGAMVHGQDEEGRCMSHAELLGNLRLLGFAGHETTASVMTWMMIRLGREPALWQRLRAEALAADGPPLGPSALARFPFAEALFREALRVYPPAWFVLRRTREDIDFEGVVIPTGHLLILPIVAWSRSPTRYSDPDRFDPDRWLGQDQARHPIETCQFGGGPHFCLGYRLALLEGIHFIVAVARLLGSRGLRPVLRGPVPSPRYLPFTRAPARTALHLEHAG
jgi:cytochrome P450